MSPGAKFVSEIGNPEVKETETGETESAKTFGVIEKIPNKNANKNIFAKFFINSK